MNVPISNIVTGYRIEELVQDSCREGILEQNVNVDVPLAQ